RKVTAIDADDRMVTVQDATEVLAEATYDTGDQDRAGGAWDHRGSRHALAVGLRSVEIDRVRTSDRRRWNRIAPARWGTLARSGFRLRHGDDEDRVRHPRCQRPTRSV